MLPPPPLVVLVHSLTAASNMSPEWDFCRAIFFSGMEVINLLWRTKPYPVCICRPVFNRVVPSLLTSALLCLIDTPTEKWKRACAFHKLSYSAVMTICLVCSGFIFHILLCWEGCDEYSFLVLIWGHQNSRLAFKKSESTTSFLASKHRTNLLVEIFRLRNGHLRGDTSY